MKRYSRYSTDTIRVAAQADSPTLCQLVFDDHKLVAAFARRDDAEQWIEQCGHPAMELCDSSALVLGRQSKKVRADKPGEKIGKAVARRR
jgi:hypothetical protein